MVTRATMGAALLMTMWLGTTGAPPLAGQTAQPAVPPGSGREAVLLLVRPRVGDTLHLQMEQMIEFRGRRGGGAERGTRPPDYGPRVDPLPSRVTRLLLYAHSLVEASDLSGTTLLATSDSMALWVGSSGDLGAAHWQPLQDDARQVRVRVMPDGSMRMHDPPPGAATLGATLASVPGLLPEKPIKVGAEWARDMPLPALPVSGMRADGVVQVKLRLDSLTRGGRDAWISLAGVLRRSGAPPDWPPGTRVITAGTIRGHMLIDRQRAWIMGAFTELDVASELAPGAPASVPMLLDMRVVQHMRVR